MIDTSTSPTINLEANWRSVLTASAHLTTVAKDCASPVWEEHLAVAILSLVAFDSNPVGATQLDPTPSNYI